VTRPERIVFAGSPEFAVVQLDALHAAGAPLAGVLSQPDRPAGRKRRLQPTPVKARALDLGLPVQTPSSLRRGDGPGDLAALEPDLLVVAAYGLILPRAVLELPRHGCLNVHASLLPRWRGAAPVERAIMAGDAQTGVCIMAMDEGLDTGAVLHRRAVAIGEADTGGELEATLAGLGAAALLEVLDDLDAFPPEPQPEAGVTYAAKLTREDALVDFDSDARSLAGRIRALNPRLPVAVTTPDGTRLRLLRARAEAGAEDAAPGTVLALEDGALRIAAADGSVAVHELQVVGGKGTVLSGADLVNALRTRVPPGAQLRG
jgi:methionyl-tRNA formyltransferase